MNREVKQEIKAMEQRGWAVVRICGSGHILMRYKDHGSTIVPATPSDRRWLKNKRAEAKRIENGGTNRQISEAHGKRNHANEAAASRSTA